MVRRTILELLTAADNTLPDNSTGEISPADVRDLIKDFLDTMAPAYAALSISSAIAQAVTVSDTVMVFSAVRVAQAPEWTAAVPASTITNSAPNVTRVTFNVDILAATNRTLTFTLYANGVATPWTVSNQGDGTGNPQAVSMTAIHDGSADASTVYTMRVRADANASPSFENAVFVCENLPRRGF